MGSKHSTQRYARRKSLVKDEFDFPEPSWDYAHDWEIYHVDVELDILPPHVRHKVYVRLDSYTQEIIEEEYPQEGYLCSSDHHRNQESSARLRSSNADENEAKEFLNERDSRCESKRGVCFVDGEYSYEFSQYQKRSRDAYEFLDNGCISSMKGLNADASYECGSLAMSNDMFLQWEMSLEEDQVSTKANPNREYEMLQSSNTHRDCNSNVRAADHSETPRDSHSKVTFRNCIKNLETHSTHIDCDSTSMAKVFTDSYELDDHNVLEKFTKGYVPDNEDIHVNLEAATQRCVPKYVSCVLEGHTRMGNCGRVEKDTNALQTSTENNLHNEDRRTESSRILARLSLPHGTGRYSSGLADTDGLFSSAMFSQSVSDADDNVFFSTSRDRHEQNTSATGIREEDAVTHHHPPPSSRGHRNRLYSHSQVATFEERNRLQNMEAFRKNRKFSLKDEPGWIPNPLDSDSEDDGYDDFNDSGVFSDAASSPVFTSRRDVFTSNITAVSVRSSNHLNSAFELNHLNSTFELNHLNSTPAGSHQSIKSTGVLASHAGPRRYENADSAGCSAGPALLPGEKDNRMDQLPSAAHLARKGLALQIGRRRHNSEPTLVAAIPVSSAPQSNEENGDGGRGFIPEDDTNASRPSSLSDDRSDKPKLEESRWRLVRLMRGRRRKTKPVEETLTLPAPCCDDFKAEEKEEDGEDLDEQLAWMTRPTDLETASQAGTEPSSPDSDSDAVDFSNSATLYSHGHAKATSDPNVKQEVIFSSSNFIVDDDRWLRHQSSPAHPRDHGYPKPPVMEPELELDWLCEPEWNNFELELFWSVLRPHIEKLLNGGRESSSLDPCVTVCSMDAEDHKMLDRCLLHVQWHIWKGNYRQAVADFQAVRRHFRCCAESHLIESETRDDVESLRLVFQRKRPSRFRFWI